MCKCHSRSRLDRFDACSDCLCWKVRKFLKDRKDAFQNFMKSELDYYQREGIL